MKKTKVLICDDQGKVLTEIRTMLRRIYGDMIEIETTRIPEQLLAWWEEHPGSAADILLMDIEYPYADKDGIEIARELQLRYPSLKVIFITGLVRYAQDIFYAIPSGFLVKPIDEMKMRNVMDKLLEQISLSEENIVALRRHGNVVKIASESIRYIESDGHNIVVYTNDYAESFRMKLSDCNSFLPEERFWRIHQSYIVSAKHVKKMTSKGLELWDGIRLPVARSKYKDIRNRLFNTIESQK
ncbi:LytTR family two component transcriptional regulator [Kineothrix alysoides]|uniref:Stage 0 sporulation protein A homolog n=1 Tax=Kineothrix alysoides TaxID=1469948 RepID=A0A4R1QUJ0_9FIRM|nr:LytTR family DNA-binding domain-containing protein [Kineothrix alysoides]TCL56175.1 LytTR family two component transcriptional regulator [Kineothrix alysoides]